MDMNKCLEQARKLASKAKPFILKHDGKVYTAVFNQQEWVYQVYENGFFLLNINLKSSQAAKKFLLEWLTN